MKMRKKRLWWESALESHYLKKTRFEMQNSYGPKKKGAPPLANTNES
jgi:hypothetical protein